MTGRGAAWASLLLAGAASILFVVVPTGTSVTATPSRAGSPPPTVVAHHTLLEHEGPSVLVVLAVPVLVAAFGALPGARLPRAMAATLLWVFTLLGAASVGLFYAPATVAMTLAAFAGAKNGK